MVRIMATRIATDIPIFGNTRVSPNGRLGQRTANVDRHGTGPRLHPERPANMASNGKIASALLRHARFKIRFPISPFQSGLENALQKVVNSSVSSDS